jgi:hypothetical protein
MRCEFPRRAAALALLGAMLVASAAGAQTNPAAQTNQGPQNPGAAQGDTQPAGSEPEHANPGPTGDATRHAPIGAGAETMPAKFDEEVAARDRIAIMARPLPLSAEQKQQIYASVMNNDKVPVTQTIAEPATILPAWVEFSELPPGMEDQIPAVRGYKYVKLQDKVLLVIPESRVVVGEIQR